MAIKDNLGPAALTDGGGKPAGKSGELARLRRQEETIRRQNLTLGSINRIYESSMSCQTAEELGAAVLEIIESVTESGLSFVIQLGEDGNLRDVAVCLPGKKCLEHQELGHSHFPENGMRALYRSVLQEGKSLLTNDPARHPDMPELPEWHLMVHSFLCVPFLSHGKVAGLVAVANKQGGYTEEDRELLEALAPTVVEVLLRRRAEEAVCESEKNYQELVKYAPAGIYEMDFRTKRFLSVNDAMCKISGYSREELLSMNALDFLNERCKDFFRERTAKWVAGEKPDTNVEYQVISKDGRMIDILLNVSFTSDEDGRPLGAMGIIYDITERKRAEEAQRESQARALKLAGELEKQNRLITDFFINISHEFKTPLSILMLGLDLLEKKIQALNRGALDLTANIAVMRQNSFRLNRLVANLLDITKLDAGFMEPQWELKNVAEWLGSLVKSTELYARQKGLELTFACNVEEKMMFTDGFMLDRIMLNLLSNAIKHTPEGGRIDVVCQASDGGIAVSVKDTGEGIPEDRKGIIFDRFRQVSTSLVRASEGCGIGLALTKSLVELLGGRIWFESEAGLGSEFSFELPALAMEAGGRPAAQSGLRLEKRVQMELSDIEMA